MRLQRAFLSEIVRLMKIHLAVLGLNPDDPRNAFTLNMASVAPIVEIERAEVVQLRMDRMERAINFGTAAALNQSVWVPYVLEKIGGLPRDLVRELTGSGDGAPVEGKAPPNRKALEEAMASLVPAIDDGPSMSSVEVVIDGTGRSYAPTLNEGKVVASTNIEYNVEPTARLATSPRAEKHYSESRRKRAMTRVQLVTALAGLPPEAATKYERSYQQR
jgi:hypothetical protein